MIVTVLKFDQVKNWPWLVVVDHGWVVVNMKNFTQTCRYAYQSVAFLLNINSVSFEHGRTWSTMVEKWFRPKTFAKHTYTHIVRKLIKFEVELITVQCSLSRRSLSRQKGKSALWVDASLAKTISRRMLNESTLYKNERFFLSQSFVIKLKIMV